MHTPRCLPLLHEHPKREELLDVLVDAGESAWARGAHEVSRVGIITAYTSTLTASKLAIRSFISARTLLRADPWLDNPSRTISLLKKLAA